MDGRPLGSSAPCPRRGERAEGTVDIPVADICGSAGISLMTRLSSPPRHRVCATAQHSAPEVSVMPALNNCHSDRLDMVRVLLLQAKASTVNQNVAGRLGENHRILILRSVFCARIMALLCGRLLQMNAIQYSSCKHQLNVVLWSDNSLPH